MILLFTDFGPGGPYVGQMKAVLLQAAPGVPLVDLMADAPAHDPMAAAYLLAALAGEFAPGSVFLAVVDPGVGSARRAVAAEIDGRWYVAPDNGLLEPLLRRAKVARAWRAGHDPGRTSSSSNAGSRTRPLVRSTDAGWSNRRTGDQRPTLAIGESVVRTCRRHQRGNERCITGLAVQGGRHGDHQARATIDRRQHFSAEQRACHSEQEFQTLGQLLDSSCRRCESLRRPHSKPAANELPETEQDPSGDDFTVDKSASDTGTGMRATCRRQPDPSRPSRRYLARQQSWFARCLDAPAEP